MTQEENEEETIPMRVLPVKLERVKTRENIRIQTKVHHEEGDPKRRTFLEEKDEGMILMRALPGEKRAKRNETILAHNGNVDSMIQMKVLPGEEKKRHQSDANNDTIRTIVRPDATGIRNTAKGIKERYGIVRAIRTRALPGERNTIAKSPPIGGMIPTKVHHATAGQRKRKSADRKPLQ